MHNLEEKQVAEYKELFMLFDRDQDGVLSFTELGIAMKTLGQRPTGEQSSGLQVYWQNKRTKEQKVSLSLFVINNLFSP